MARTIPSHSAGVAFSGSPAAAGADGTPGCRVPGARRLWGAAGSLHISCLCPFPKDLALPTVMQDLRPAGPLVSPTVTVLKFLHQGCVCVRLQVSVCQRVWTTGKINCALIARPKSPQASYSSPPSPSPQKELHFQLQNKSKIKGAFYLLFELLKKEIFQFVSTAAGT